MRKTPSYLKGLAETRARVSAEVQRYQQLHNEIGQALEKAKAELTACDTLIKKFDERLNPEEIEPIKGCKGRYGKRGALKGAIEGLLRAAAPAFVSTTEIGWKLQVEFQLDFIHAQEREQWLHRSVARELNRLTAEGLVVRQHSPTDNTGGVGSWRWKGEGCESLGDLAKLAQASGVETRREVEHYEAEDLQVDGLPI